MDYTTLTDSELQEIFHAATEETSRRNLITAALQRELILQTGYLAALGRADGEAYVPPTGAHDAYPKDWTVRQIGKTYRSTRNGANGIPGESPDWILEPDGDEVLEWEQRQAGSEYPVGSIVSLAGRLYRNDHSRPNGWKPGTTGSQWTDIGPA